MLSYLFKCLLKGMVVVGAGLLIVAIVVGAGWAIGNWLDTLPTMRANIIVWASVFIGVSFAMGIILDSDDDGADNDAGPRY